MPNTTLQLPVPAPLTTFAEDEILFRDNIRQFADDKLRPLVKEMDEKGVFDHDLIQQFFQLGLMGIEIPEHYGGGGAKFFEAILAVEEMSRVDASAGYRGITAFIVEKQFSGFTVGKKEDKLGIRASSTCELILEDCRVPKSNVLGEVGKGYKIAIETLNEGRIGIGAQMAGVARGAWEYAARYAQERKQFGKTIADFQGIQFQIAQMATEIEAARLMVYNAARMKDSGVPFVKEAAMTKLFCSQVAERVTSLAIEIYGGDGFTKDYPVEKYWRDSKIGKIYEGTSNMQLATIAKLVLGGK